MGLLDEITWKEFLIAVIAVTVVYYLILGLLFSKKDIRKLTGNPVDGDDPDAPEAEEAGNHELLGELEIVVNDIRHGILEQAGKEATKDRLLEQLKARVAGFGGLHRPAYRYALNNFIIQHSDSICGVAFSEEELDAAWESLPR